MNRTYVAGEMPEATAGNKGEHTEPHLRLGALVQRFGERTIGKFLRPRVVLKDVRQIGDVVGRAEGTDIAGRNRREVDVSETRLFDTVVFRAERAPHMKFRTEATSGVLLHQPVERINERLTGGCNGRVEGCQNEILGECGTRQTAVTKRDRDGTDGAEQ